MKKPGVIPMLLCVVIALQSGCSNRGHSSPQAVFDCHAKAQEAKDWKTVYKCMNPERSDETLFSISLVLAIAVMDNPDAKAELEAIHKSYGVVERPKGSVLKLDDQAQMKRAASEAFGKVKNKGGLFADMMDLLTKQPKAFTMSGANLQDLKIDGDSARGIVVTADGTSNTWNFVKLKDGWYIDFFSSQ